MSFLTVYVMSSNSDHFVNFLFSIKSSQDRLEMEQREKAKSTRVRRPVPSTSAHPAFCPSDSERMCEDGSCIARVELCPEEQLMNQNTILIMIVVGLAVVVFLVILYCFQQRQRRANRQLGIDSGFSDDCDNESLYAPPPAYDEVINSNMYPATPEQRRLRQISTEDQRGPITPPPNYASALIILARSQECLSPKEVDSSSCIRRCVSLEQVPNPVTESDKECFELKEKTKPYSKHKNIFRFSRQFSRISRAESGNNNANSISPRTPRSPPPYSPVIPQSPPPPLTPLPADTMQSQIIVIETYSHPESVS